MTSSNSESPQSFEALLRPHLDRLYRLAYRLTGTVADAEDLVQDVLIKIYGRREELTSILDLAPWLGRVLYNQFIDEKRRYAARRLHAVKAGDHCGRPGNPAESLPSDAPGPEAHAERWGDITQLSRALDQLSDDHRLVVLLHDGEGYTLAEIQGVTGVPLGTLKSRLHRARARLRELLGAHGTF